MDREIAPEVRREKMLRKAGIGACIIIVALTALWTLVGWVSPSVDRDDIRTARVERGDLEATIAASGVAIPSFEKVISSPIDARVMRVIRPAGANVVAGDPLVELDLEQPRLAVGRLDQQIAQKQNEELRLGSSLSSTMLALESSLEQKKLDLDMYRYRAAQNRKLLAEGLVSDETMRQSAVAEKKAEIEIKQLQAAVASARRENAAQLGSARLEREMLTRDRGEAARQLELATARSDRAGVVTWITPTEGATVRRGDVLAKIADLSGVRVEGSVSDVHAATLRPGMEVVVRADGKSLRGRIASVAPAVTDGAVKFIVDLGAGVTGLHSQQRVDIDIITARKRGVLKLRKGSFDPGSKTRVFVIDNRNRAMNRTAELGLSGTNEYEIVGGLTEGEEVILTDMRRYAELKQVRVK
jgi:HlyD family secretion protein